MSDELKVIDGGVSAPNAVLKTLDLAGFKSFVHKTHLEFAPGITAIIGPNGSGKTNLVDALRWALGENNARILRAKRNEELIFGGSESRKALGFAEVLMQLDNTSRRLPIAFTEVEVGRRLFRNGDAEYLVNRSRVRLRDMQELLAGANLADGFAAFGVRAAIVPLFVRDVLQRSAVWTGIGFGVVAVLNAATLLPGGRLADRLGRRPVIVAGCLVSAAGMLMLALVPGLGGYLAALAVFGLGSGLLDVGPAAMLGDILGGQGGTVVAAYQMAGDIGSVTGPVSAGYLVDVASYVDPWADLDAAPNVDAAPNTHADKRATYRYAFPYAHPDPNLDTLGYSD